MSEREEHESSGEVSEVSGMPDEESKTPISDSQGVAGNPDSPDAEEFGEAGPDANPHRDRDTH